MNFIINNNPLVTIIIDTFNRPEFLKFTIKKFFLQTYDNIEIIIVDNGSTIETKNFLNKIKTNSKIKIIKFDENQFSWDDPFMNVRVCFNKALNKAKGELIYYNSDDDWVSENFIEKMVDLFVKNKNCVSAIGQIIEVDKKGNEIYKKFTKKRPSYVDGYKIAVDYINNTGKFQPNPGFSFMLVKELLIQQGGFQESMELHQLFCILPFGESGYNPEAKMYWRRHAGQLNRLLKKKIFFSGEYELKLLENSKIALYTKWEKKFGISSLKNLNNFFSNIIYTNFFQNVFLLIFNLKFFRLSKFILSNKMRFNILEFKSIYLFNGLKEAFRKFVIIRMINTFFKLIFKSSLKEKNKIN